MRPIVIVVVVVVVGAAGCNFAVKHPAVTAGAVAGTLGLGTCELASSEHAKCFAISGGAGVGLGLIAALALWLGTEDEVDATAPGGSRPIDVDPTNLEPAPVFIPTVDAGVAPAVVDAALAADAAAPVPVDAW